MHLERENAPNLKDLLCIGFVLVAAEFIRLKCRVDD